MATSELTKETILSFLSEHKFFFKKQFDIDNIMLFGSYARDEAQDSSDIDILIESNTKSFDNQYQIKKFLEKHLNKKIDVVYIDGIHPFIMRFISKEMIYA